MTTGTSRRPPGAGSVTPTPAGTWRVRVRDGAGRRRCVGTYADEAEARKAVLRHFPNAIALGGTDPDRLQGAVARGAVFAGAALLEPRRVLLAIEASGLRVDVVGQLVEYGAELVQPAHVGARPGH